MSTIKSRVNISLPDEVRDALITIAKRDQMPPATKAARLIELGLETEEDMVWDIIAAHRDSKGAVFHSHSEVLGS